MEEKIMYGTNATKQYKGNCTPCASYAGAGNLTYESKLTVEHPSIGRMTYEQKLSVPYNGGSFRISNGMQMPYAASHGNQPYASSQGNQKAPPYTGQSIDSVLKPYTNNNKDGYGTDGASATDGYGFSRDALKKAADIYNQDKDKPKKKEHNVQRTNRCR
jgi:hypothetical protein